MHSTNNLEDGYLGSGKRLLYSVRKHGNANHFREIIEFLPDRKSLSSREKELITEEMRQDINCMNIAPGGGGFYSEEHQRNATLASLMPQANSRRDKTRRINHKIRMKNPEYCKLLHDNLSKSLKGNKPF